MKGKEVAETEGRIKGAEYATELNGAMGVFDPSKLAREKAKHGTRKFGTLHEKLTYERAFRKAFQETFEWPSHKEVA